MILRETLDAEMERLSGLEAAETRARFACLARCDFSGAWDAWQRVKQLRRQRAALITGELFSGNDET